MAFFIVTGYMFLPERDNVMLKIDSDDEQLELDADGEVLGACVCCVCVVCVCLTLASAQVDLQALAEKRTAQAKEFEASACWGAAAALLTALQAQAELQHKQYEHMRDEATRQADV